MNNLAWNNHIGPSSLFTDKLSLVPPFQPQNRTLLKRSPSFSLFPSSKRYRFNKNFDEKFSSTILSELPEPEQKVQHKNNGKLPHFLNRANIKSQQKYTKLPDSSDRENIKAQENCTGSSEFPEYSDRSSVAPQEIFNRVPDVPNKSHSQSHVAHTRLPDFLGKSYSEAQKQSTRLPHFLGKSYSESPTESPRPPDFSKKSYIESKRKGTMTGTIRITKNPENFIALYYPVLLADGKSRSSVQQRFLQIRKNYQEIEMKNKEEILKIKDQLRQESENTLKHTPGEKFYSQETSEINLRARAKLYASTYRTNLAHDDFAQLKDSIPLRALIVFFMIVWLVVKWFGNGFKKISKFKKESLEKSTNWFASYRDMDYVKGQTEFYKRLNSEIRAHVSNLLAIIKQKREQEDTEERVDVNQDLISLSEDKSKPLKDLMFEYIYQVAYENSFNFNLLTMQNVQHFYNDCKSVSISPDVIVDVFSQIASEISQVLAVDPLTRLEASKRKRLICSNILLLGSTILDEKYMRKLYAEVSSRVNLSMTELKNEHADASDRIYRRALNSVVSKYSGNNAGLSALHGFVSMIKISPTEVEKGLSFEFSRALRDRIGVAINTLGKSPAILDSPPLIDAMRLADALQEEIEKLRGSKVDDLGNFYGEFIGGCARHYDRGKDFLGQYIEMFCTELIESSREKNCMATEYPKMILMLKSAFGYDSMILDGIIIERLQSVLEKTINEDKSHEWLDEGKVDKKLFEIGKMYDDLSVFLGLSAEQVLDVRTVVFLSKAFQVFDYSEEPVEAKVNKVKIIAALLDLDDESGVFEILLSGLFEKMYASRLGGFLDEDLKCFQTVLDAFKVDIDMTLQLCSKFLKNEMKMLTYQASEELMQYSDHGKMADYMDQVVNCIRSYYEPFLRVVEENFPGKSVEGEAMMKLPNVLSETRMQSLMDQYALTGRRESAKELERLYNL